ncbi:MAG: hypothetical protein ACRD5H_11420, partial [Nitrososphaerales archaeon]
MAINEVNGKMSKNLKIGIIVAAAIVPLILLSAWLPGIGASEVKSTPITEEELAIFVDFSVAPETEPIVVEKGKTTTLALKVQAPNNAEKTLKISLVGGRGNAEPEQFDARLSTATVVLSQLDVAKGKV